jgi:thioredoxin 1
MAGQVLEVTDADFEEKILQTDRPALVDFWATWCMPCKAVGVVVEEIAGELADKLVVGKLDIGNNPNVAVKFGIVSVPTVVLFKNGEMVERLTGPFDKRNMLNQLEALL